jgi:hypothetical protein
MTASEDGDEYDEDECIGIASSSAAGATWSAVGTTTTQTVGSAAAAAGEDGEDGRGNLQQQCK